MPYKKNRGSGLNSRRKDNDLSRSELISKYGFSTFRESDTDQAKLNTKRPSPDFLMIEDIETLVVLMIQTVMHLRNQIKIKIKVNIIHQ